MTFIAKAKGTGKSQNWSNLMPDGSVATGAFYLVIGYMFLMHEWRGIFNPQDFRFTMALETLPLRNMTVPLRNMDVALLTGHSSRNILSMIKTPAFDPNISLGFNVARGTNSYSTRNAFFFPSLTSLVEMADKTIGLVNGKMRPLDKLGMAACAP
jgi:hypothetical protein